MSLWIIISYIFISVLCIYSAVKLYSVGKNPYGKAVLSTYIFYTLVFIAVWIFKISVPSYILFITMLTILGSCFFGHYLGGYTKSKIFDRYLHAFGAFSFSLLIYCIIDNYINTASSKLFQAIFIFLAGSTLGVFFELIEMCHDRKKDDPKCQKGLKDTNMDMLFNLIGKLVAGLFAYFWLLT